MLLGSIVFQALLSFNRFLYQWASQSTLKNIPDLQHGKLRNNSSRKNYDIALQEFVLIKTQYKVLTNVLKRRSHAYKLIEVDVLL